MARINKNIKFFILIIFLINISLMVWAQDSKGKTMTNKDIIFEPSAVVCPAFMGFGVEWDPGVWRVPNEATTFSEADWELVVRRIAWMKVPVMRIMMQTKWCYQNGKFNFETPQMKLLYKHLEICQKMGITVILSDWGCEPEWLKIPEIANVGDPLYAKAIGTYMEHLLIAKKFGCIKYFVMVNEPNYEVGDFGRWRKGAEQVVAAFAEHGLDKIIKFMGSDESSNESWHRQAVDQIQTKIGAYDFHRYADEDLVRSGKLYELIRAEWAYAISKDPMAKNKPMVIGEAGMAGGNAGNNPQEMDFNYGVKMADYAIQALGAGSSSVSAWMLEDSSHKDFTWGMWKNKENKFELKPWFYAWALLCRFVPKDAIIYSSSKMEPNIYPAAILKSDISSISPTPNLRVLAAKLVRNGKTEWTFVLANRGDQASSVDFKVLKGGHVKFSRYLYAKDSVVADKEGFPVAVGIIEGDLEKGLNAICPPQAVCVFTTLE